jgi:acyl-CoA thioester hydrolase
MACFELWRDGCGAYQVVADRGLETIVVSANVRYHRPARYDDELQVAIGVSRIGATSFELLTHIRRDGDAVADAHVTYVFVDAETFEKTEPPDDLRRVLQGYLVEA